MQIQYLIIAIIIIAIAIWVAQNVPPPWTFICYLVAILTLVGLVLNLFGVYHIG